MIFLETQRLCLRNWKPADIDVLCDYRSDERCAKYQRWEISGREKLCEMLACEMHDDFLNEGTKHLAIALRESDELVGEIKIFLEDPTITLGYTVSYRHHRKGYAFEMLSAVIAALHERYPCREVICLVEPENTASIALLQKLGFADLGYAERITSQVYGLWPVEE